MPARGWQSVGNRLAPLDAGRQQMQQHVHAEVGAAAVRRQNGQHHHPYVSEFLEFLAPGQGITEDEAIEHLQPAADVAGLTQYRGWF